MIIPDEINEIVPPSVVQINLLRQKVDSLGVRKLEVLAGNEREELLNKIIDKDFIIYFFLSFFFIF